MADVLRLVFVSGLLGLAFVALTTWTALWRLRRRNRLHPCLSTAAPLTWLGSPNRAARLHRRLRASVVTSGWEGRRRARRRRLPADAGDERLQELAGELAGEAVTLDAALVAAALAPRPARRHVLDTIEPSVVRLERVAGRLAALRINGSRRVLTDPAALDALEDQLDALEAARLEVDGLEAMLRVPGDPFGARRLDRPA